MIPDLTNIAGVLFDVDGTLIDSNEAHAAAWVQALAEHGIERELSTVRRLVGMGSDKFLPAIANIEEESAQGQAIGERKKALFSERLGTLRQTRGARDLLTFLRRLDKTLVVATSADDKEMESLLSQAGVADLIPVRSTKDQAAQSKPDPDIIHAALARCGCPPEKAVMVGDTPYDLEAADRAGVASIALRCGGFWKDADLAAANQIVDDPEALRQLWARAKS